MFTPAIKIILFSFCALFAASTPVKAQSSQKTFKQESVWSIFVREKNQAKRDSLAATPLKMHKPYYAIAPFLGYNPAYGFVVGVSGSIGLFLGDPSTTPISSASVVVNLTTKAQKIFNFRTNMFTGNSRFILRGDWRFMIFSQPTYGLGTGITHTGDETNNSSSASDPYSGVTQKIDYDYLRLYETFYFRIISNIYLGLGYSLDHYVKIEDLKLNLDTLPQQITSHYRYSTAYGFNPEQQTISGISLELLMDTRNNSIRPVKGYFANIAFKPGLKFLGSTKNSLLLNTEFRTYVGLSKHRPDHLVGFWYLGQFSEKGTLPYLGLPAIGWDMYNRQGRGYIQGSIRGVNFVYGETEYRFPISRYTGILGGVLFVNATTASSDDGTRRLFQYINPAAGLGLRVMFNRRTLSNIAVDCGFGADGSFGVYFNINETF